MIMIEPSPVPRLLIVGASTRAAAFSAVRAGWQPICLDRYADADLQACATTCRVEAYPDGLIQALAALPAYPLMYVGGLETNPELIQALADRHPLWGNDAETVLHCRDQSLLEEVARMTRVGIPAWRSADAPPPRDGQWIVRPVHGTGGRGIVPWTDDFADAATRREPHLFQQRIQGESYSALFIAPETVGDVRFVGMTRQLVGESACHAAPFQWCGNIGPVSLSIPVEHLVRRLGNVLKWKLGLRGIFGVDFMIDHDETVWMTDVNPRYPASAELLEFATGLPLVAEHARCFDPDAIPEQAHPWMVSSQHYLGKAVLYARRSFTMTQDLLVDATTSVFEFPEIADIPAAGEQFTAGDPVCTLFATANTVELCWNSLQERLSLLEQRIDEAEWL